MQLWQRQPTGASVYDPMENAQFGYKKITG